MTYSFAVATNVPNGKARFADANNVPLAGGKVYFYIPSTTTPKNTWQDPFCTALNTNPVTLDNAGSALIYGVGEYQQAVYDVNNNLIWTQLVGYSAGSGYLWCGSSSGSSNVYSVTAPTDATSYNTPMKITFIPNFTNTGNVQINVTNVNGTAIGNVNVYKNSGSSLITLAGGEIISGVVSELIFDGTQFQLSNIANIIPSGVMCDYAGSSIPSGWLACYGQAVSRSTYSGLFSAIGTTFGIGDGSTTFNLPDVRGRIIAGLDNMGGSSAGRLNNIASTTLGGTGGDQNLQSHTHTATAVVTDPGHNHTYPQLNGNSTGGPNVNVSGTGTSNTGTNVTGISVTVTNATSGTGTGYNIQPTIMMYTLIKI